MISAQTGKPNLYIVQDGLVGLYRMTRGEQKMSRDLFFDISLTGTRSGGQLWRREKMDTIARVFKKFSKPYSVYCGKALFSLLLPDDLMYENKNDKDSVHPDEPAVKIFNGVMYEGFINKAIVGPATNSLIQILHKEYGVDVTSEFIDNVHFMTNKWLSHTGFSMGLGDCMIEHADIKSEEISNTISKCYLEAHSVEETTINPLIKELRITSILNKAKDIGMRIAKNSMSKTNNFLSTVYAGSKGDFYNIAQVTGLLGQQNLTGKRIVPVLNHKTRALPHYPFGKLTVEDEYESKGFIKNSFVHGLNPKEFYFHAMSGREGVCDTAMGKLLAQVMLKTLLVNLIIGKISHNDGKVLRA